MKLHELLDTLLAGFFADPENAAKLPSTTTVLELTAWLARQMGREAMDRVVADAGDALRCTRCHQFLSAARVEMRLPRCSRCDR